MRRTIGTVGIACALAALLSTSQARLPASAPTEEPLHRCFTVATDEGSEQLCAHADAPPPGVELGRPLTTYPQYRDRADTTALVPARTAGIECYGDGTTGARVQAIYAYGASAQDKSALYIPDILTYYVPRIDSEFNQSAAETGGERHVRWATDSDCNVKVDVVKIPDSALGSSDLTQTINELRNLGYNRADRVYLVWGDANVFCGVGGLWNDDGPSGVSRHNRGPNWSRVDLPCWGYAESHELSHNFGAVQSSAPNATANGHCHDEYDRMCYADSPDVTLDYTNAGPSGVCQGATSPIMPLGQGGGIGHERRFDCNHDDYYNTNPPPGNYLATHWNIANSPFLARTASVGLEGAGAFHPLTAPYRFVDTRLTPIGRLRDAVRYTAFVLGPEPVAGGPTVGVPLYGAAAVALNVTVAEPLLIGFLSVRPFDPAAPATVPTVSNLNFGAGQTVANLVIVPIGPTGGIELYSSAGTPFVIADIVGWFADGGGYSAQRGGYHALTPARVMDTRSGLGGSATLGPNSTASLKVLGAGGVPNDHVGTVALNVTAADATAASYLSLWAKGTAQPNASNVNFVPGRAVPNLVLARVGAGGAVDIFNAAGSVNVIVDVAGWFDDGQSAPPGAVYHAVTPTRAADTRGAPAVPLGNGAVRTFALAGVAGVPPAGAIALVANFTAVSPTGGGYFTVFPTGVTRPDSSNVNFAPNQTVPNLVFATFGGGSIDIFNFGGTTHALIDVGGWFGSA